MRRYPAYKDSGVEWLGEVPDGWTVRSVRSLARPGKTSFIDGDWIESPFITDEGVRLLQTGNIGVGSFREQGFRYVSDETFEQLSCTEVEPNDVLICRLAEPVGRACLAPTLGEKMITSVDVAILKPSPEVEARFVVYLFSSPDYLGFMEGQCRGGTRDRVSRSFLGGVRLALPPLPDQTAIAAFLDRETAKIDALVAEQRRLIELLREKRQAVISHAVTKGLNPSARMKPSGINWLGDVPEGWEVVALKRLTPEVTVGIVVEPSKFYAEEGIPALRSLNIKPGQIGADNLVFISPEANELHKKSQLQEGDLVAVRTGQPGTCAVIGKDFAGCNCIDLIIIRKPTTTDSHFLRWYLTSEVSVRQFAEGSGGAIQQHFNVGTAVQLVILVPPVEEQRSIVRHLEDQTAKLDTLTATAETAITLLQERRAALISAAVTGKIDVRHTTHAEQARPDPQALRMAVAGAIIARMWRMPTFGRVKNQKVIYLAEACAGVSEFGGHYIREAAGPLDRELLNDLETRLTRAGVIAVDQPQGKGTAVVYRLNGEAAALRASVKEQLGTRHERFDRLLECVADLDTRSIEAVATLFAVWNDFLIEGQTPTDSDLIREVLENWHPEKPGKFTAADLAHWLQWMRRKQIVPTGQGPRTSSGRLF